MMFVHNLIFMIMEIWHIWIIIALLFFILEIFTSGFAVICISIGALAAAAVAGMNIGIKGQLLWFSIATVISFVTVRPVMLKYFHRKSGQVPTNTEALIGRVAIVCETIDSSKNSGAVKIDGDIWRAESEKGKIIGIGEKTTVMRIDSTVLTVKKS